MQALEDVCDWLQNGGGEVAVFDATNTTRERRKLIYQYLTRERSYKTFFIESICMDDSIIEANIKVCSYCIIYIFNLIFILVIYFTHVIFYL